MKHLIVALSILLFTTSSLKAADPDSSDDTYNGQPIGTAMTTDDAGAYIDSIVKTWLNSAPSGGTPKFGPEDMARLSGEAKRVGMPNLLAAYGKTAPDTAYHMNVTAVPQNEITRSVIEKAISLIATPSDLDSILSVYDQRPLILAVLNDHPEFDGDSHVTDFL